MEDTNKKNNNIDILEDLQKIKDFIRLLWTERKLFYKTCGCAVVLALVVAFSVPKRYTVEVALYQVPLLYLPYWLPLDHIRQI